MRDTIAVFGGSPIFEKPLQIVRPTFPNLENFAARFQAALASGQVTNNSAWVLEFEHRLSEYLGVPTLAFCNGQMALMAMLRAAGIESGEVIVPSFTFAATPHAVRWCGAEPVFADIAADASMCLDPADVRHKITSRTVAILGVDAYGIACDYAALTDLGRKHGLRVVFDSAPAFGTRVNGRLVGGFGDAQIFSFHATKAFTTMEGGCLCTHSEEILDRARAIRNFGQSPSGDCAEPGINAKLTEMCALIGIEQLTTFERAAETRRRAVDRMRERLSCLRGLTIAVAPDSQDPIWLYLPVLIDRREFGLDRNTLAAALEKENVYLRKYYSPPCHHMTAYRAAAGQHLPFTETAANSVLALPVYNDMTEIECDGIVQAFAEVQQAAPQLAHTIKV
jgi:dTDP-4-amino-4,6-dideoxy-D-glucose transaminase